MKRPTTSRLHVKERYPAVFRALQSDARDYPGGVSALADQLGRNYGSLKNALCPTCHDSEPTAELLLDVIDATGGHRTVTAIARLGGMTALPLPSCAGEGSPAEVAESFMAMVGHGGKFNAEAVKALEDSRLSSSERDGLGDMLDRLIGAAVVLRALVRGR